MNKKGFTLIELLAVIVILAIIAVIAVPIIGDIIYDSRVSAFKESVKMIADSGKYSIFNEEFENGYEIDLETLNYKGKQYDIGSMYANEKGQISLYIWDEDLEKCAVLAYGQSDVYFDESKNINTCKTLGIIDIESTDSTRSCYTFDSANQILEKYDLINCSPDIVIPTSIEGIDVKYIDSYFARDENAPQGIQSVDFTSAFEVISIDDKAFTQETTLYEDNPWSLGIIDMSSMTKLTVIERGVFYDTLMDQLILPEGALETIGEYAFQGCGLTEIQIPDTVQHIEPEAFRENLLTEVEIPSSVTLIEDRAFYYNTITQVTINNIEENVVLGVDVFARNGEDKDTTIVPTYNS